MGGDADVESGGRVASAGLDVASPSVVVDGDGKRLRRVDAAGLREHAHAGTGDGLCLGRQLSAAQSIFARSVAAAAEVEAVDFAEPWV